MRNIVREGIIDRIRSREGVEITRYKKGSKDERRFYYDIKDISEILNEELSTSKESVVQIGNHILLEYFDFIPHLDILMRIFKGNKILSLNGEFVLEYIWEMTVLESDPRRELGNYEVLWAKSSKVFKLEVMKRYKDGYYEYKGKEYLDGVVL